MKIYIHSIADCQKCGIVLERLINELDIRISKDPKKSDLLVIVGCLLKNNEESLINTWNAAIKAKIILFGDCPSGKSVLFSHEFNNLKNLAISEKKIEELIPIDSLIDGCPPKISEIKRTFMNLLKNIK